PDSKTRRYDRQLRLWAASGQSALENAHLLVISGSATSTSILKNLVLPGIGKFTVLDHAQVTPEDAGNNFFLEGPSSIGKSRAEEAVRLLGELNEGVVAVADTSNVEELLETNPFYFTSFSIVLVHNLESKLLDKLSTFLWSDDSFPPLVVIRSAGFLAEFFIQFHEHTIIESHSETAPSLRIDKAFPALLEYSMSLDFATMDPTDHTHIPYVPILVRALQDWKKAHDGRPPQTYPEKIAFKKSILDIKVKFDEENFDEAESQAYRCWSETGVPSDIAALFQDPQLSSLSSDSPPFFHLLEALRKFTLEPPHTLPLTSTLPDMKANTDGYIHLQKLYKARADEEKARFKSYLTVPIDDAMIDSFVKNAHALKVLRGKKWGALDTDPTLLVNAIAGSPKQASIHLSLSALSALSTKQVGVPPTVEALTAEAQALLAPSTELPEEFGEYIGEVARAPTADLPNTAALLGGLVSQEVIKFITKQIKIDVDFFTPGSHPQEFIDLIVVELSGDSIFLEVCSTTAKMFREVLQRAPFKTLRLSHEPQRNAHLDDTMTSNTLLQTYVRALHLMRSRLAANGWNSTPTCSKTYFSFIRGRTLERMILRISGFPFDILKDLQSLTFVKPNSIDPPNDAEFPIRGHLESLTVIRLSVAGIVVDTLTDPHPSLSLSSLKRFNSAVSLPFLVDTMQFQKILDLAAHSLEIITIILLFSTWFHVSYLASLNNLRSIHVTVNPSPVSLDLAAAMFDIVPEQNRLLDIKFVAVILALKRDQDVAYDISWSRLDELLARSSHLKISRLLNATVTSRSDDEFRSVVLQRLAKLRSRG
ncbi:NEDD8-activating enzyme E1 regulatory subunit, partial [Termitomyces sp. J132]